MKILVVSNSFPASDKDWVSPFAFSFVSQLIKNGHKVTVVAPERFPIRPDTADIDIVRIPAKGCFIKDEGLNLKPVSKLPAMIRMHFQANQIINRLCKENQFDIGLAFWAIPSGLWLAHAKKLNGLPFFIWVLGSDIWKAGRIPILKNVTRKALVSADYRYADGHELAEETRRLCDRPCEFLPTSRKLPKANPLNDPQVQNKKIFVFIGRWEPVKGVDILINAFAKARLLDAVLLIFGLGSQEDLYQKLIRQLDAEGFIVLKGLADAQAAADYLSIAHCCVIPSRMESIPVVLSDALQCQCPVLATRVGDMERLVDRYKIGLTVPPDDVHAISDAIIKMADHKKNDFENGIKEALNIFDIQNAVKNFESQASRILNSNKKNL